MKAQMLEDKVVAVTGATRGIGRQIALSLAQEGADLIINGTRAVGLEKVKAQIEALGRKCVIAAGDVSDPGTAVRLVETARSSFGRIDVLVNNAGINDRTKTVNLTNEGWLHVININLNGVFYMCHEVLPLMVEQGSGCIVNITSANGVTPHPNAAPSYGASKAGVTYLTKHFALEYAPYGIRVNAVQCGPIASEMTDQWTPEYREQALAKVPLHRLGKPEEVAAGVLFLCTDMSGFMTGASINMSGGKLMQ
jgi:3-oxoacyl-[acyl-carrier protein] reductase